MPVRPNPFASRLAAGKIQIGTWIMQARNPSILPLLKSTGLDFAKADMEHTPLSLEAIADMAVVARALDFPLVVRPPEGDRVWITRLLDAGVWNLYIPQIHTVEMAQAVVAAARHAPLGNRGTFEPGPQNDYTLPDDPTAPLSYLNEQVHLTIMLESIEAFENLDEIAAVPGIDALAIGPADLAQELGVYDTPQESQIIDQFKTKLRLAAKKHNKTLEMGVWSADEGRLWIDQGAQIVTYKTDTTAIRETFSEPAKTMKEHWSVNREKTR